MFLTDRNHLLLQDDRQELFRAADVRDEHILRGNAIFEALRQCNLYKVPLVQANFDSLNDMLARNAESDYFIRLGKNQYPDLIVLTEFELNQMQKYFDEWIPLADPEEMEDDHILRHDCYIKTNPFEEYVIRLPDYLIGADY